MIVRDTEIVYRKKRRRTYLKTSYKLLGIVPFYI